MKERQYHIIRSNNWAPLEFFGKEPNMGAFVDELIYEIAAEEQLQITLSASKELDPQGLFILLDAGQYDAIVVTFSPNTFIKDKYLISNPIYNAGPVLIVSSSSNATSLKDLQGRGIGIKNGSSLAFEIGRESSMLISYDSMISALEDVDKNIIAGVIMDAELAEIYIHGFYKDRLKIATSPLTDLGLRLVAVRSDEGKLLIQKFNEGLTKAEKDGEFEKLIQKWGLTNP
jgi:ABC-type amino acid transport substrate-binding protein